MVDPILSIKAEAISVGPFVVETMGLSLSGSLSGSLCSFGRKYMVCVSTLLGGATVAMCIGGML